MFIEMSIFLVQEQQSRQNSMYMYVFVMFCRLTRLRRCYYDMCVYLSKPMTVDFMRSHVGQTMSLVSGDPHQENMGKGAIFPT